jgi:hypothetical protein
MRPGAAADAEVARAERERVFAELTDLVAVAQERIERGRERPSVGPRCAARISQALERRLGRRRPIWHRQRGDVAGDRRANLAQQGQGRRRPARAVHPDHVGAGVLKPPARLGDCPSLAHAPLARNREGDHRRLLRALDRLERHQRLAGERVRLADDEIDAGVDRPADLLVEDPARLLVRLRVVRRVDAGITDVARQQSAGRARDLLRDRQRRLVDLREVFLASDDLELGAVRVVGERFDDIRAGVDEVAVEALDQLGVLEHDLGHVGAGLQIAAALELEQIAFGADDRPRGESFQQSERFLGSLLGRAFSRHDRDYTRVVRRGAIGFIPTRP